MTVVCSSISLDASKTKYKNCRLKYIPLKANGWQSILFDIVSLYKTCKKFDKVLILGCSGSIAQPFFFGYKHKFIMNLGGLDWKRSKWSYLTRKYLKFSEKLAVLYSGFLISDNQGISDYLQKEYERDSFLIAYGGDQAFKVTPSENDFKKYPFLTQPYAFTVARIQPDNNIELLLESFNDHSIMPFVFVGNWKKSSYGIDVYKKYQGRKNLILLDAIYDQTELNLIRSNCKIYLHGHSAGGTNPALVEAMSLTLPIVAFDCVFNRYTTNSEAVYFSTSKGLNTIIENVSENELNNNANCMIGLANTHYKWENIANLYSNVLDQ